MFDDLADGAVRETDCLVAFFDITGFMAFAKGRAASDVLAVCAGYFDLTGAIIDEAGGRLIKILGDAGLCAFDNADNGVAALRRVQHEGDSWLRAQGGHGRAVVKAHWGTVAFGLVGAPGTKRLDVYGDTVNTAAILNAGEPGFAMTPQVFRQLSAEPQGVQEAQTAGEQYSGRRAAAACAAV